MKPYSLIDEETGMTGAMGGLKGGLLEGEILLNLDTGRRRRNRHWLLLEVDVTAVAEYDEDSPLIRQDIPLR